jgi:hypothetical protein
VFKLAFSHFWSDFNPHDNVFYELISELYPNVQVVKSGSMGIDLELTSTFSSKYQYLFRKFKKVWSDDNQSNLSNKDFFRDTSLLRLNPHAKRTIWFTGENIRPPIDSRIDGFMSFDQDSYKGQNIYFPLWQLSLREKQTIYESSQLGDRYPASNFLVPRNTDVIPPKFACAFINNLDPYRIRAIEALREHANVDVYGKRFGRFVPNKTAVAKDYKFILSFENDFFPGYVTEKLFDAYACNSIPLYWGSLGNENIINEKAFINVAKFSTLQEFAEKMAKLTDSEWISTFRQPLLKSLPDFRKVQELLVGRQ